MKSVNEIRSLSGLKVASRKEAKDDTYYIGAKFSRIEETEKEIIRKAAEVEEALGIGKKGFVAALIVLMHSELFGENGDGSIEEPDEE